MTIHRSPRRRSSSARASGALATEVAELHHLLEHQQEEIAAQREIALHQEEQLAAQHAEIERLSAGRIKCTEAAPASPHILPAHLHSRGAADAAPEASNGRRASRRALLRLGGAAAAAGVAAGAVELWRPAGARAAAAHTAMPAVPGVFSDGGAGNAAVTATGSGGAFGVVGTSDSAPGVQGTAGSGEGVFGYSTGYYGVHAYAPGSTGLFARGAIYGASLQGNTAPLFLQPQTIVGAPESGIHSAGEVLIDSNGNMFVCEAGGTPGMWQRLSGVQFGYPGGAVNLLPVPMRLLDTRAGAPVGYTRPGHPVAYQATLQMPAAGVIYQSQTIPAAANAIFGNLVVALAPGVNPGAGSSLIAWPNGQPRPAAVNIVYNPGDLSGEYTGNFTLSVIGGGGLVNLYSQPINPVAVDLIFDAFGFVM